MLARHLSDKMSTHFDSSQAENKYRYYEQKYHKAKLASQRSGFGVDEADRAKGINNIEQKMESLCSSYYLWDSWFGSSQKYAPASVMSPRPPSAGSESDVDEGRESGPVDIDSHVNEVHGGEDGAADDAAAERDDAAKSDEADIAARPGEAASQAPEPSVASHAPSPQPSPLVRPKGKSAAAASAVTTAVAAATGAKNTLMAIVATSPSTGGTNSSKSSSNFDQVYASVQAAKSA